MYGMSLKSELWRYPLCDLPGVSQGSLILMLAMHDILIIKNGHLVQHPLTTILVMFVLFPKFFMINL